jgi:hypothetical protein
MTLEDIDLEELAEKLQGRIPTGEPRGYLRGKLTLREEVRQIVGCTELEAEELVETLEERGYLRFHGDPSERSQAFAPWEVHPDAEL